MSNRTIKLGNPNRKGIIDFEKLYFLIMVVCIYVFNFQTASNGNTITNIVILGFFALEFYKCCSSRTLKMNKYIIIMMIFIFYAFISAMYSVVPDVTMARAQTLFLNLLLLISLFQYFVNKVNILFTFVCLEIGGSLAALYSILFSNFREGERTTDLIGNANTAAIYLSYAAFIALYFALKHKHYIFHIVCYFLIVFAILITGSRSGTIVLLVGTVLVAFKFFGKNKNAIKKLFFIGVLVASIVVLQYSFKSGSFLYDIIGQRFQSLFEIITTNESSTGEGSTFERMNMIELAFKIFTENPILGCGLGGIGYYIKLNLTGYYTFCHNNYMEILSGLGALGFCLYYSIHANIIATFCKIKNKSKIGDYIYIGIIILIAVLVSHMFIVHYYYKMEFFLIAFIASIVNVGKSESDDLLKTK